MSKGCLTLVQQMIFQINPSLELLSSDLKVKKSQIYNGLFLVGSSTIFFQFILPIAQMLLD